MNAIINTVIKVRTGHDALQSLASHYHLVLVGTGLSWIASTITSEVAGRKIKMLPWTEQHFEAMVKCQSRHSCRDALKAVKDNATLRSMIDNPRCSTFLLVPSWIANVCTTSVVALLSRTWPTSRQEFPSSILPQTVLLLYWEEILFLTASRSFEQLWRPPQ